MRLGVATRPGYPRERLEPVSRRFGAATASSFFEIPASTSLPRTCAIGSGRASRPTGSCRPPSPVSSSSAASTMRLLTASGGHSYAEGVDAGDARPLTPIDHARRIAALAQEKLAADVVILDMRPVCSYTDFFVVCTGQSRAADEGDRRGSRALRRRTASCRAVAGERQATWILADYLDVVLRLHPEARSTTASRRLWGDVRQSSSPSPGSDGRFATVSQRGAAAQLGERLAGSQKVAGSSPVGSIASGRFTCGRRRRGSSRRSRRPHTRRPGVVAIPIGRGQASIVCTTSMSRVRSFVTVPES